MSRSPTLFSLLELVRQVLLAFFALFGLIVLFMLTSIFVVTWKNADSNPKAIPACKK